MKFFLVLLLLLVLIFQTGVAPFLSIGKISPDLLMITLLLLAIWRGFEEDWWAVLLGAIFLDMITVLPFGLISLAALLAAYLIHQINKKVFSETKTWSVAILVGAGTLLSYFFLWGLAAIFKVDFGFDFYFLFWTAVYNGILGGIIFYVGKKKFLKKIFY